MPMAFAGGEASTVFDVLVSKDASGVLTATSEDIPGLVLECASEDELCALLPDITQELMELNQVVAEGQRVFRLLYQ